MNGCPYCQATDKQVKAGINPSRSQLWQCQMFQRRYTPKPVEHGYPDSVRQQAVKLYVDGMNYRRIARHLGVDHKSVINAHTAQLPPPWSYLTSTTPNSMNRLPSSGRKNLVYVMTLVDRTTSCLLGWAVERERTEAVFQQIVDQAPQAAFISAICLPLSTPDLHATHPCPTKAKPIVWKAITASSGIILLD